MPARGALLSRLTAVLLGAACLGGGWPLQAQSVSPLNQIAERYVRIVLALGQHDPAYVDAYYGPEAWKTAAEREKRSLADIATDADRLLRDLQAVATGVGAGFSLPSDRSGVGAGFSLPDLQLRKEYLLKQLSALRVRVRMLQGARFSFDEESRALYDAVAPSHPDAYFQSTIDALNRRLPGSEPLIDRLERFRQRFVIPTDRLADVFSIAIGECRRRTLQHVTLPADERFTVEYVTNKSWSGYNWYQGQFASLIQVNTDLPIYIDRAVDLACHEGYPGHHVYNVLLEQTLVRDRGWVEMTIYPLFSPQSLIAEGSANYGIEVAFPGDERVAFERERLFPAAGLNPQTAAEYYEVQALVDRLSYAGNEAARRYLNGAITRAAAAEWLTRFALMSPPRAEQRTRFMDDYRSYVINYNLGKDLVKAYVESKGGATSGARWTAFLDLLRSPRLASGLR